MKIKDKRITFSFSHDNRVHINIGVFSLKDNE